MRTAGTLLDHEPFARHTAFTLWRLAENPAGSTHKPVKVPVHYDGITRHSLGRPARRDRPAVAPNPAPPLTAEQAAGWLAHNLATGVGHDRRGEVGYLGIGFRPEGTGLVCIDLDDCVIDGAWTPGAQSLFARFPGALIENSVSGKGAHIWFTASSVGRRPKQITPLGDVEVYGAGQFIACGTVLSGDACTDHTAAVHALIAEFWPDAQAPKGASVEWDQLTPDEQARVIEEIRSALPFCSQNTYAEWTARGMALVTLGDDIGLPLWHELSELHADYDEEAVEAKWFQLTPTRTGYPAIFSHAETNGWVNPRRRQALPADAGAVFAAAPLPEGALLERPVPVPGMPVVGTEDAIADEFVQRYGNDYRVVPGMGWMRRNGPIFEPDNKLRRFDQTRHICRLASAQSTGANRLGSAKTVNGVLTLAQSDPRIVVGVEAWDSDAFALNTPDGVVDLRTGELRPHSTSDLFTQVTRVAPIAAPCPTWAKFLQMVFADAESIAFMQRSMGYWLTGDRSAQVVHFLYGMGGNGKSVLIDLVQHVLGPYATKMPAAALMQRRGERHPTEIAMLRGKRLAVSSELPEGEHMNEPLIKELTGDAAVSARLMRQDYFQFEMTQKHVLVGNHKPRLYGGDEAIARRLLLVGFHATFKGAARDPAILDKLKAEAPAVLHWMVQGAVQWHADGGGLAGLRVPAAVAAESAEYMAANDDVATWVAERCSRDGSITASAAYSDFRMWKTSRGETPQSIVRWSERLLRIPGISREKSSSVFYRGLSVNAPGVFFS
jgi:putative DNA primase/helicase